MAGAKSLRMYSFEEAGRWFDAARPVVRGMRGTDTSFNRTSRAASLSGLYDKHRSSLNATGEP